MHAGAMYAEVSWASRKAPSPTELELRFPPFQAALWNFIGQPPARYRAIAETLSAAAPGEPAQAAELWRRFDRCLELLLGGSDAEAELETVIRQAEERGLTATAERAKRPAGASST